MFEHHFITKCIVIYTKVNKKKKMKELFFDFKSYKELILTHKISQV